MMFILIGILILLLFVIYLTTQPIIIKPDKIAIDINVDSSELRHDVEYLINAFAPRDADSPENLERMAKYLRERFLQAGARVMLQRFDVGGNKYLNVIASFGPEHGDRIVVGAHYDTCCKQPGADDNTSGVVGLLTIAPLLSMANLKQRIDLVAFTLEEPPFFRTDKMGSAQHAKYLAEKNIHVSMMIALEMIGYFTDEPGTQNYPVNFMKLFYPATGNFLAVVGKTGEGEISKKIKKSFGAVSGLPVCSINAPAFLPGIDFSDHLNYWRYGFPAVMLTDTAFYRNKNYHTADDLPATLDYTRMSEVIRGVYYFLVSTAKN